MEVTEYKAEYRLSRWSEIIREQKQSGKTVREWCAEHGMTTNAYYYRLRCVRESICRNIDTPEIAEIPLAEKEESSASVRITTSRGTLEINCASTGTLERLLEVMLNAE